LTASTVAAAPAVVYDGASGCVDSTFVMAVGGTFAIAPNGSVRAHVDPNVMLDEVGMWFKPEYVPIVLWFDPASAGTGNPLQMPFAPKRLGITHTADTLLLGPNGEFDVLSLAFARPDSATNPLSLSHPRPPTFPTNVASASGGYYSYVALDSAGNAFQWPDTVRAR